jgi:hypothetical protein
VPLYERRIASGGVIVACVSALLATTIGKVGVTTRSKPGAASNSARKSRAA